MNWRETDKGDPRCRRLADRHYSRQTPGARMWTRPGYNFVLYTPDGRGAVFVWWRPKWESGILGTERADGLRAIECTIFRNESGIRSSELIRELRGGCIHFDRAQGVYRHAHGGNDVGDAANAVPS